MPIFGKLQRASWGGIEFPIRSCGMKGSFRHHEHIYQKTPGAATEKNGRGLYHVEMLAVFDVNIKGYSQLWPQGLASLRRLYEQGATAPLVIPTVGSIPAWLPEWDQEMDAKVQSGETARFSFHEDQSVAFLANALAKVSSASVDSSHAAFQAQADAITPRPDIFDKIQDKVNEVLGFYDQAQLRQNLLAAKIEGLAALIREADRDVEALQDPSNFAAVYALQDLLAANLQLARDITQTQGQARIFIVPQTMSVGEISTAIYGDTSHFDDIVSNNSIEDPFEVIASTQIIYFTSALAA